MTSRSRPCRPGATSSLKPCGRSGSADWPGPAGERETARWRSGTAQHRLAPLDASAIRGARSDRSAGTTSFPHSRRVARAGRELKRPVGQRRAGAASAAAPQKLSAAAERPQRVAAARMATTIERADARYAVGCNLGSVDSRARSDQPPERRPAIGPYSARGEGRGSALLLRPDPARPRFAVSSSTAARPTRRGAAWRTCRPSARRPGRRSHAPCADDLHDRPW